MMDGSITNCHSTGAVNGGDYVGGLVGWNPGIIGNCYSTGAVIGTTNVGGLVGLNDGSIKNSYWNTQTSGKSIGIGLNNGTSSGVAGLTTAQMMQKSSYMIMYFDQNAASSQGGILMKRKCSPGTNSASREKVDRKSIQAKIYNNLGLEKTHAHEYVKAESLFRQAIEYDPNCIEAYVNLGLVLYLMSRLDEAEKSLCRAIQLSPDCVKAYNNLGLVFINKERMYEAEKNLCRAIQLSPDYADAYFNLGAMLYHTNRMRESEMYLCRGLQLRPDNSTGLYHLGRLYLHQGKYELGWKYHEARLAKSELAYLAMVSESIPRWRGEDLNGRSILLIYEQGFGDTIQFIRYVKWVAAAGARGIVLVPQPLGRLLEGLSEKFSIHVEDSIPAGKFDFNCPLMSLPYQFHTVEETIPRDIPYVRSSPEISAKWRQVLQSNGDGYRIGVIWAVKPNHSRANLRSIPFAIFSMLFDDIQATWVSLQINGTSQILRDSPHRILDLSTELTDFAETAGVIDNLDLMITVDTAVAHLAGAMGKKVWTLLDYSPDWRWQLDREDSPWYPTMRLFRQRKMGDWQEVLVRVKRELRAELGEEIFDAVNDNNEVSGLVEVNSSGTVNIISCYSTGTANCYNGKVSIANCYSAGKVSGTSETSDLVVGNGGNITSSSGAKG